MNWSPLLKAVGLPESVSEIEATHEVTRRQMPIAEFRQYVRIGGNVPGYYEIPNVCLAGSAVLAWLTRGTSHDHDYFAESIPEAQEFVDWLMSEKGYYLSGFQGEKDWLKTNLGEKWEPDPHNIASWYCDDLGCSPGKNLPTTTRNPLDELSADDIVRALNFRRSGSKKMRQIILLIRGTPPQVIDSFDFSIVQWAIDRENVYWGQYTIQDMVRRRVRIGRIHHPLSTFRRMLKYANRGYYFCNGTMLEIARALAHFADAREAAGFDPLASLAISVD